MEEESYLALVGVFGGLVVILFILLVVVLIITFGFKGKNRKSTKAESLLKDHSPQVSYKRTRQSGQKPTTSTSQQKPPKPKTKNMPTSPTSQQPPAKPSRSPNPTRDAKKGKIDLSCHESENEGIMYAEVVKSGNESNMETTDLIYADLSFQTSSASARNK